MNLDNLERPVTAIAVPEGEYKGAWIAPVSRLIYLNHSERTLEEMRHGRMYLLQKKQDELGTIKGLDIKFASDDQWNFVLGLVVCGVAKRIDL
jgi:hypothetical protein